MKTEQQIKDAIEQAQKFETVMKETGAPLVMVSAIAALVDTLKWVVDAPTQDERLKHFFNAMRIMKKMQDENKNMFQ